MKEPRPRYEAIKRSLKIWNKTNNIAIIVSMAMSAQLIGKQQIYHVLLMKNFLYSLQQMP